MKRCYLFTTCVSLLYYTPLFSQSNPSYLLKVNITDSIRHLLEHELLDRCHIEHQVSFNVGTYDMDTAVTGKAAQTAPSLSDIKKQQKKLCHCGKDWQVYHEIGCIYDLLNMSDSAAINYDRALKLCKEEEKRFPDSTALSDGEAMIWFHKKEYNTALEKFEKVLQKNKNDSIASETRLVIYLGLSDTASMVRVAKENLQKNPDDALSAFYFIFARDIELMYNRDDPRRKRFNKMDADSVLDFSCIYRIEKKYPQYHYYPIMDNYMHLFTYFCMKFTSIMTIDTSDNVRNLFVLFDTLHIGKYREFFKNILREKWYTNYYSGYKALAFAELMEHDLEEAGNCFRKAIDHFPLARRNTQYNSASDYMNLSMCYWLSNDSISDEKVLKEDIRQRPGLTEDPLLYLILARHEVQAGDFAGAKKNCAEALRIDPHSDKAYCLLSVIASLERNYKEALANLDKAFKVNDNEVSIVVMAGIISLLNNSPDTAHTLLKQAYDYDNTDIFVENILKNYFL
ncbi:MAG TPA: hypothetical protein VI112_00155 [Bacteroidia bacterium]|jgi:tetratricopeptide (TPR) repeat protein